MKRRIRHLLIESTGIKNQFVHDQFENNGMPLPYSVGNLTITADMIINAYIWKDEYLEEQELFESEVIDPIKRIVHAYNKGGIFYRIVFLNDISELNKDYLGMYWIGDTSQFFEGGISYIEDESGQRGKHGYIIKAKIPPYIVNCQESFIANMTLIEEVEIRVLQDHVGEIEYLGYQKYRRNK